jgi:hypothetical protein
VYRWVKSLCYADTPFATDQKFAGSIDRTNSCARGSLHECGEEERTTRDARIPMSSLPLNQLDGTVGKTHREPPTSTETLHFRHPTFQRTCAISLAVLTVSEILPNMPAAIRSSSSSS